MGAIFVLIFGDWYYPKKQKNPLNTERVFIFNDNL